MGEYQVIARKYRPQFFRDVIGQEALVSTLINAIRFQRISHAYLFCGSRGTGKTTVARVFAKAINCPHITSDCEPCGVCSSCKEVALGNSLDFIEIDGASHRGIDDIRQINETVGYSPSYGKYKVYLIDEVHMLTKEAFNALLKTLEEPPPTVKFIFATTEPHRVPTTILSRCQRFQLNRISIEKILQKLKAIAVDLTIEISQEALDLIANASEGSLRDAESLLDQIIAFQGSCISTDAVIECLGLVPKESFFQLDEAFAKGNLSMAFEISHQVYSTGRNISSYIENLIDHFRNILLLKLESMDKFATFSDKNAKMYKQSAVYYTKEQCLHILDLLMDAQLQLKTAPSILIALEAILLKILRSSQRVEIEQIVGKLIELEKKMTLVDVAPMTCSKINSGEVLEKKKRTEITAEIPNTSATLPEINEIKPQPIVEVSSHNPKTSSLHALKENTARYDTLMRFAAVELEGTFTKSK